MTKNLIIISLLFLLSNCGISSSALLGPTYTGVKTGSVYQTSLSYSSGKVINQIKTRDDNPTFPYKWCIQAYYKINPNIKLIFPIIINDHEVNTKN